MELSRFVTYLPLLCPMVLGLVFASWIIGPSRILRSLTRPEAKRPQEVERFHVRFFHAQALAGFFIVLVLPLIPIASAIKEFQSIPDPELTGKGLVLLFLYSVLIFVALTYSTRKSDLLWNSARTKQPKSDGDSTS